MTEGDRKLLIDFEYGIIHSGQLLEGFSTDLTTDHDFIRTEIEEAMKNPEPGRRLHISIPLIWLSGNFPNFVDLLNELLLHPGHHRHQEIAKDLQDKAPSPSTVPFVRKVLETNYDHLEYTGSESLAITGWFSHLLYAIGTKEAIDLMKEYSNSSDEGIATAMRYRLKKVEAK